MEEYKSYTLPTETLPALELKHHLNDLKEFNEFLVKRGIKTINTRIERYIKYFQIIIDENFESPVDIKKIAKIFNNSVDEQFKSPLDWHLYILREVHELMWILKGLKVHIPLGIDEKLEIIVNGKDFAALDSNTNSRNIQFELRIASYFCQFNCKVDLTTETDVIAYTKNQVFYLECKRVSNKNKLQTRLSEARKQLERRMPKKVGMLDICGCIAVDVTKVAFSHNGLTFGVTTDHSRDIIQDKLKDISSNSSTDISFDKNKNLCNYWFQIHIPAFIKNPPLTATRFSSLHFSKGTFSRKQHRAYRVFCDIFKNASHTDDERIINSKPLKFRESYIVPTGTEFSLDNELLDFFLKSGDPLEDDSEKVIGSINLESKQHEFFLEDFKLMILNIDKKERKDLAKDYNKAAFVLIMKMYSLRYPYVL